MNNKFKICKVTRGIAAESLQKVLAKLLFKQKPISEVDLRDAWLFELRKHKEIFPDGWYTPPPHGIGVLFATEDNADRLKFTSLRHQDYWPKENIFLDREKGFALFYCSPVDKKSGIIGDFGLSIYFGKNKKIIKVITEYLKILTSIFKHIALGMRLADVHIFAKNILEKYGFTNEWWVSITDPTGTNYGHTIPATYFSWTKKEQKTIQLGEKNWQGALRTINLKRKFINAFEPTEIIPGMAITIEPRSIIKNDPKMPTIYFHTIAMFYENGEKELLTGFDQIFELAGMDYIP